MIRRLSSMGGAWLLTLVVTGASLPDAYAAAAINVTALPPASCPTSAIPNDGVVDTAAFVCAIGLIPTGGVPGVYSGAEIYIPAGTYDLDATISVTDRPVAFRGEGQGITRLVWRATTAPEHYGLKFRSTSTSLNFTLAVRSLSLLRSVGTGGAALSAGWAKPVWHGSLGIVSARLSDIHVGSTASNVYWSNGIDLINPTTLKLETFNIQGGGPDTGNSIGIRIHGSDATGKSIGTQIRSGSITRWTHGIEMSDGGEGLHVQMVSIHDTVRGLFLANNGPGTVIANNSIHARSRAIQLYNSHYAGMAITNNRLQRFGGEEWIGVDIYDDPNRSGNDSRIIGNSMYSPTADGNAHAVVINGTVEDTVVMGNTSENMNIGVWLRAGTVRYCTVVGNSHKNVLNPMVDWGVSNHVMHNTSY